MRRQLFMFLCMTALVAAGSQASAGTSGAGATESSLAHGGGAAKPKPRRHPPKPQTSAPDTSTIDKDTTARGAIQAGRQSVRTDKTLNDNTMKILPP